MKRKKITAMMSAICMSAAFFPVQTFAEVGLTVQHGEYLCLEGDADGTGNVDEQYDALDGDVQNEPNETEPLTFSGSYKIPDGNVNSEISEIDVSDGVSGGKAPYNFSASGLPSGLSISGSGIISGAPTVAGNGGSATVTVTDSEGSERSITVSFGKIKAADVSTPAISPDEGTFTASQNVTISCATSGARIYYTTDGETPTASSTLYSGTFTISSTTTVKAIAIKDGMENSDIATVKYTEKAATNTNKTQYILSFETNGGTTIKDKKIEDGTTVSLEDYETTRTGYRFLYWCLDSALTNKITSVRVTENIKLYAKWKSESEKDLTLIFDTNGGSAISKLSEDSGAVIDLSKYTPTKTGYFFGGWYSDDDLETAVTKLTLNTSKTIYAKWTKEDTKKTTTTPTTTTSDGNLPFSDVKSEDWFYDSVKYVYDNGLMKGLSDTVFSHNAETTRAMLVSVLYRLDGGSAANGYEIKFKDVDSGAYYAEAVRWAASNGIIGGYDDETFAPNDSLTREQMVTVLFNYAKYKGYDITKTQDVTSYSDKSNVSGWAENGIKWAVANELIKGVGENTIAPKNSASRSQFAAIIMRFISSFKK